MCPDVCSVRSWIFLALLVLCLIARNVSATYNINRETIFALKKRACVISSSCFQEEIPFKTENETMKALFGAAVLFIIEIFLLNRQPKLKMQAE